MNAGAQVRQNESTRVHGPGVVVKCLIDGFGCSDSVGGESVVVGVEVAAGVGDVGSSGEPDGADRQVAEGCQASGCCACADLGVVFSKGSRHALPTSVTLLSALRDRRGTRSFSLRREGFTSIEEVTAVPDLGLLDLRSSMRRSRNPSGGFSADLGSDQ